MPGQTIAVHAPTLLVTFHAPCHMLIRAQQTNAPMTHSQILSSEPKLRSTSRVTKDDELCLEKDITENGLPDAAVALKTAEAASTLRSGGVVHVASWHDGRVAFDLEGEVGKRGPAVQDLSTVGLAVGGSRNLRVVVGDEVVWEEEKGSSGVGDGGDALADWGSRAHGVPAAGEAPETLGIVHGGVGDIASVLAGVNVAEVVASWLTLLQVGGEEWGVEAGLGVGEEGLLLVGLDSVDRAEGETEKAIALILGEFRADGLGQLNGLAAYRCTADVDDIGVNVAAG